MIEVIHVNIIENANLKIKRVKLFLVDLPAIPEAVNLSSRKHGALAQSQTLLKLSIS